MKKSWEIILKKFGAFDIIDKIEKETNFMKVFPKKELVFHCFDFFEIKKTKIVILGQDPYHTDGVANGLAFSSNDNVNRPPSLRNIFTELEDDLGIKKKTSDLSSWAKQGILLLNITLTVEEGKPNSHAKMGWEEITNQIIVTIDNSCQDVIFLFLGEKAKIKSNLITKSKNLLFSSHPSPLSSYRGFFGSKVFSKINDMLINIGSEKISW